jgi:hypothetical protein
VRTPNLVANPGAELGGSGQGGVVTSIPGWRREAALGSKMSTVVEYGAPGFPTLAQSAALGGGSHFFAGGPADGHDDNTPAFSHALITQDLNIPADAMARVKAGGGEVTVSACLGGYANQDDHVEVLLYAYTTDGMVPVATINGPQAADRHNTTGLLPRSTTAEVPLMTTSLAIGLDFVRVSGEGTYNDGYADNVSVRIGIAGSPTPPPDRSPIAPASGGPAPSPPAPSSSAADSSTNTAAPLARVGQRVRIHRGVATLKLRCVARDGDCAGSVTLTTRLGKLGSGRFVIAAGDVGTIRVKVGRAMRHRLAGLSRKRLARLTVTATARIGAAATTFTLGATR